MSNGSEGKDVLSSLPHSRPQRRSAKRDGAKPAAKARPKPKATVAPRARPKQGAAKSAPKPKVAGAPRPSAATRRARAESVKRPPAARPTAAEPAPESRDIVSASVQAAGELARIGITLGTQIVREATRRLPKP
jgi:hypothetical protein